jgi:hypothetical protein
MQWPKEEAQAIQWPKEETQAIQWPKEKAQTIQWPLFKTCVARTPTIPENLSSLPYCFSFLCSVLQMIVCPFVLLFLLAISGSPEW